ncbi:hypothetical protein MSG28_004334 [Choristoneura fumiferana]|uniref:Uncharacterized protein n=1 Tax=Choristoneura fumiferana TaxID=7141 RepID=A0ACC0KIH8_CHOFU|nr:hypothetical protein MSG28_004334 [Choristoneura fumiferana]
MQLAQPELSGEYQGEILRTQDKDTVTDSIITAEKTVQARIKRNVHYRSKAIQTICQKCSKFLPLFIAAVSALSCSQCPPFILKLKLSVDNWIGMCVRSEGSTFMCCSS